MHWRASNCAPGSRETAAGFVSYGGAGGRELSSICSSSWPRCTSRRYARKCCSPMMTDFQNFTTFKPEPQQEKSVGIVLDQVVAWGGALKQLR